MTVKKLKVARIGNSRGVRLPAETLRRYRIGDTVLMEEKAEGLLLRRPSGAAAEKLSWDDTAREIAAGQEAWGDWDAVDGDGLRDAGWPDRVADAKPARRDGKSPRSKRHK